jgi:hypothetical protein
MMKLISSAWSQSQKACLTFIYLFICSLFNDTFSVTQITKGWQVNDELERIWKEAVMA